VAHSPAVQHVHCQSPRAQRDAHWGPAADRQAQVLNGTRKTHPLEISPRQEAGALREGVTCLPRPAARWPPRLWRGMSRTGGTRLAWPGQPPLPPLRSPGPQEVPSSGRLGAARGRRLRPAQRPRPWCAPGGPRALNRRTSRTRGGRRGMRGVLCGDEGPRGPRPRGAFRSAWYADHRRGEERGRRPSFYLSALRALRCAASSAFRALRLTLLTPLASLSADRAHSSAACVPPPPRSSGSQGSACPSLMRLGYKGMKRGPPCCSCFWPEFSLRRAIGLPGVMTSWESHRQRAQEPIGRTWYSCRYCHVAQNSCSSSPRI